MPERPWAPNQPRYLDSSVGESPVPQRPEPKEIVSGPRFPALHEHRKASTGFKIAIPAPVAQAFLGATR